MSKLIRKISIGKDYKNDAMHYAVGQEVYGGHTICDILEEKEKYSIYIKKNKEKVVDLQPEKISEQELKELQNTVAAINKIKFEIGNIEAQKSGMLQALSEGNGKLGEMQLDIQSKYGTVDVNIQTGVINRAKDEPSNS